MTTLHTPRSTFNQILVENPLLVANAGAISGTGNTSSFDQFQIVAGNSSFTAVTFTGQSLVQPTTPGYYLVTFIGNAVITSSATGSGVQYRLTVGGSTGTITYQQFSGATSGTQPIDVCLTALVSSPLSVPVLGASVSNINSGDSTGWNTRSLSWVKLF